jgi:putative ABC transport system ATP-binding protein
MTRPAWARRDERGYREYLSEEQRSQAGCSARRLQLDFHHGLLGSKRMRVPVTSIGQERKEHESAPVIELENVTKDFKLGAVSVRAVRSLSLRVGRGEFAAITGPSGSGKTTILNLIGCLDVPSAGTVRIDGVSTSSLGDAALDELRSRRIGFIFQSFNLVPVLNVEENVMLPLYLRGLTRGQMRERALAALALVGLSGFAQFRPDQLSGGQRQRTSIARALAIEPSVVLADEPTANLDSVNAAAVVDLMRTLNRDRQVTFVFSTHDLSLLGKADRVIVVRDGMLTDDDLCTADPRKGRPYVGAGV